MDCYARIKSRLNQVKENKMAIPDLAGKSAKQAALSQGRATTFLHWQIIGSLMIALMLSMVYSNTAQAALGNTTATVGGDNEYTAFPGERLPVRMVVGYNNGTDWNSTEYDLDGGSN